MSQISEFWMGPEIFPVGPNRNDVLTDAQKIALLASSMHFLAPDEESANLVALEIDFIEGLNEHSSTMCGPLSISILQRAGLLGTWVEPHDFWLLNPRENLQTARDVFPEHLYEWAHSSQPIAQFDFSRFPLQAGDLVYLHGTPSDTFEHILVVNRVDSRGRAFAVSNFFTTTETIIEERMLYDPGKIGSGQFGRWADRDIRNTIGNTGGAGFRVWRVRDGNQLNFPTDEAREDLQRELDSLFLVEPGKWYAEIRDNIGRIIYQFNPYESFHPASTVKVSVAIAFMDWLKTQELENEEPYLNTKGTAGRSFSQLLRAMLVESEEKATEALVEFLDENLINQQLQNWGYSQSKISPRRSSAMDILDIFTGLWNGSGLNSNQRSYLLNLLGTYTENDDGRAGLMKSALPKESVIYNKRASLVEAPRVVGDSGLVVTPEDNESIHPSLAFSIHGLGIDGASYESLESTLDKAFLAIRKYLSSSYSS
jgi:hypothetical protein